MLSPGVQTLLKAAAMGFKNPLLAVLGMGADDDKFDPVSKAYPGKFHLCLCSSVRTAVQGDTVYPLKIIPA